MKSKIHFVINRLKLIPIVCLLLLTACNSDGKVREYHDNGNIKIVAETLNGKLNGKLTEYYESGVVKNVARYKAGVQHGESKLYDESGRIIEVQNFVEGNCKGGTTYYPNGNIKSVLPAVNEKIHGAFVKYYSNGEKMIEGTMHFDKPVGKVTSYDSLGHVIKECFYDSLGVKQKCDIYSAAK